MVYESDFYTTRRPYSSSRPYVSSYSVTPILQGPFYLYNPYATTSYLRTIPHMPYTAHKRLVSIIHSPVRIYHSGTYLPIKIHSRVRPSIIAAELNRIRYLTRPSSKSYTEEYLNSRDYIDFDDETRAIRAKTDNLLRKIHVFVPRPSISNYDETSPERLRSDDYVRRIINAKNSRKDIESLPWYNTPEKHRDIGAGHLACIKYAGGRPQSKRRPYYTVGDLVPGDVKSDVKLMSYYMKNRKAAEDALPPSVQHSESAKEAQNAPAPSVTWADEVVHEEELPEEEPVQQQQQTVEEEPVVEVEVELTAEVQLPKPKRKKEKKPVPENNDAEDMEAEYDVDGVKKQPDDETIKKVQEYLDKKAAEKKMEEERRAWELAEARRVAEELEIARLAKIKQEEDIRIAEIKEQERQEAEKQAIIERAEAARQEAERLVEDEKLYNEAVAQAIADEEERMVKEKEKEDQKKQEDEEEKVVQLAATNGVASDGVVVDEHHSEEHSVHQDLSDQDNEAKPYEVDHDEDTQIEEDEEPEELENPFVDGEGASVPVEADEPVAETPKVRESGGAGGEQGFDWSEYDNEPEGEETGAEEQAPEVHEESSTAGEQQVFDECEVASQAEADEAQIEESQVTEEAQVEEEAKVEEDEEEEVAQEEEVVQEEEEEAQATEETQEEVEETQKTQVEEVEATEEVQIEEVEATEEEAKSEEKSVHDASEEEEDEEEKEEEE